VPPAGRPRGGLEPGAGAGNILRMDSFRRPSAPASPRILDMTPDGAFRDAADPTAGAAGGAAGRQAGWLDRALARIGGVALMLTLAAGGLVLVALALVFVGLMLPVLVGAGLIAFGSLWWRLRRLRRAAAAAAGAAGPGGGPGGAPREGGGGGRSVRFVVIRR
jgi:hypothetical protein